MEMQRQRLLRTAPPPPLTLPPLQPVPPTPPPSPTGPATPPPTPPPSPASPRGPPPSPSLAPTPPPSPQAALTLVPTPKAQKHKQIFPWAPTYGIPSILAMPSHQQEKVHQFWEKQKRDIERMIDFNSHELPPSRIKKMMKSDDPLSKVAGDVPVLFTKACEMFISELTLRGWFNTEKRHRRTMIPSDITEATYYTNTYDFLVDVIPWDRNLALKIAFNDVGLTTGNNSYNKKGGINNADIGGGTGNFSIDMGSTGFVGMKYHYVPVESTSIIPLLERGEASMSQSSGMCALVDEPYGALPNKPNQVEEGEADKLRRG